MKKNIIILVILIIGMSFVTSEEFSPNNGKGFGEIYLGTIKSSDTSYDYQYNGAYTVYFRDNPTSSNTIFFEVLGNDLLFQPLAINWINDLSQIQQVSMPQSVVGIPEGNSMVYSDAYGSGIDLVYETKIDQLKEKIIINNLSDIVTPDPFIISGGNAQLEVNFNFVSNNKLMIDGVEWDKSSQIETYTDIIVKDINDNVLYEINQPFAEDNNGSREYGYLGLKKQGNKLYISIRGITYDWLQNASFPVVIDPTYTVNYEPIPAKLLTGQELTVDEAFFSNITDITLGVSDENDSTNYTIIPIKWENTNFIKCREINISNEGGATLTDYPAYIELQVDGDMQSNLADLRFFNASCNDLGGSELAYEIEFYNTTKADIWARIPSLPVAGETISVYYRNTTTITSGENITGVWDDYFVLVQHLNEASGTFFDSTSYNNDGTDDASIRGVEGKVDGGVAFDGSNREIDLADTISLDLTGSNYTIEAWVLPDAQTDDYPTVYSDGNWRTSLGVTGQQGDGRLTTEVWFDDNVGYTATGQNLTEDEWGYIGFTYNIVDQLVTLWVNDVQDTPQSQTPYTNPVAKKIGEAGKNSNFYGGVDELRISRFDRGWEWSLQTYENIKNVSNVVTIGEEVDYNSTFGTAVSGFWNQTYDNTYVWYLGIKKLSTEDTTITIYPYINLTDINTSVNVTQVLSGTGYLHIDVDSLMIYQNSTGYNATHFRIVTDTDMTFSEFHLQKEANDTSAPSITNCNVNDTILYHNDVAKFSCTVTDDIDVNYVTGNFSGTLINLTKNGGDIYSYDKTCLAIGTDVETNLYSVEAVDLIENTNTTYPNLNVTCIRHCDYKGSGIWNIFRTFLCEISQSFSASESWNIYNSQTTVIGYNVTNFSNVSISTASTIRIENSTTVTI